MELKFIGLGGAFNTKMGNTSAYIIKGKKMLLIDCGEDVFSRLKNHNLLENLEEVYIAISHLHGDHVGSLSSLIYYLNYIKNIKPKIIFNSKKFSKNLCDFLLFSGVDASFFEFVKPEFENIKIKSIETKHSKKLTSYSFIFEEKFGKSLYSADTNDIEFLQRFIFENQNNISAIFHDTSLYDYEGNNHTSLNKLKKIVPNDLKQNFYCMHFEEEAVNEILQAGFNIPQMI